MRRRKFTSWSTASNVETGCEVPNYNNVIDLNIVSPNDITVLLKIKFQKPILFDNHPDILRL